MKKIIFHLIFISVLFSPCFAMALDYGDTPADCKHLVYEIYENRTPYYNNFYTGLSVDWVNGTITALGEHYVAGTPAGSWLYVRFSIRYWNGTTWATKIMSDYYWFMLEDFNNIERKMLFSEENTTGCTEPVAPCPEAGIEAGALVVPGKYPPGPYCKVNCYVEKDTSIEGFIEAYDPINNKTTILNTVYTGEECQLTDTSSDPEPPADCTEAQNRCVEFCGVNNVQTNTCTVGTNGEILVDCVCIDYPEPEEGQGSPAPAGDPTEPSDVPDPTDPAADPAAADPETDPDLDTDKWLKAMKRAMEEGNDKMIARLNAIKDSIGVTNDAIHQGNILSKNIADNTAATANNTGVVVGQLSDVKDGLARIENGVDEGNQTLDEIAEALADETEGQPELAAIQPNNYDATIPVENMPVEEDLQGVLSDIYDLNPFADALSASGMQLSNSSSCITFPNPLGGVEKQICFSDYQSTWNAMGLVLLGLCGFMAFRIVKG